MIIIIGVQLLLMVEKIMRHHLIMKFLSALEGKDINKILIDAIYQGDHVIKHWSEMTASIPGCQVDEHKIILSYSRKYMYVVHGL